MSDLVNTCNALCIAHAAHKQSLILQFFVSFSSQLFGEHNEDEDVSPDTEDPEAAAAAGDAALQKDANKEVTSCLLSVL